jgi:murein L,D-transpeptidase YafK
VAVRKRVAAAAVILIVVAGSFALMNTSVRGWLSARLKGERTVGDAVAEYGDSARASLKPAFDAAGVSYPPDQVFLAAIKDEKVLELWANNHDEDLRLIREYPVLAASGHAGPKLREGDRQVPEGTYRIVALNPNSSYHLSMLLDYPNEFDKAHAAAEGRTNLGGEIFLHGSDVSIGCLALGDAAIEELFVLVADSGMNGVTVVIAPTDPRVNDLSAAEVEDAPSWLPALYEDIDEMFDLMPEPGRS